MCVCVEGRCVCEGMDIGLLICVCIYIIIVLVPDTMEYQ